MTRRLLFLVSPMVLFLAGCQRTDHSCLRGEATCKVSSPCAKLNFDCPAGDSLELRVLTRSDVRPGGLDALGAAGDVLIGNGKIVAVIAGIGNQNYLDPNGGSLLDLGTRGGNNDNLNQILQVTGILPGDAMHYTDLRLIDERPVRVAVQLRGTLDGHRDVPVYHLYEVRPCEGGIRLRTEVVNLSPDPQLWATTDGFYWSKREVLPFTPEPNGGFNHPSFGLLTINDAFTRYPYLAFSSHSPPPSSYSMTACNVPIAEGFNSETVSSMGLLRQVVPPRGYQVYERFLAVTAGADVASAAGVALEVRRQLFHEDTVRLGGTVSVPGAGAIAEREAQVLISEGRLSTPLEKRTPWTQVVPDSSGAFVARVPKGRDYVIEVHSFGKKRLELEAIGVASDLDLGLLILPQVAPVHVVVVDGQSQSPIHAEVFAIPADGATLDANAGNLFGQFGNCSPWLGSPHGPSPACNRLLVPNGDATVEVPLGTYDFYAFKGLFWTIQRQTVSLTGPAVTLAFSLSRIPGLQPAGTLTADLHVHGAASFDSSIPDTDRALSFAATGLDVIVASDHDVVYDYGQKLKELGLQDRMTAISGVETTGHIPFLSVPGYAFPVVIGHYNFWPLAFDPSLPRNGAPFDEFLEPGELFDRMDGHWTGLPLIELNHPWADAEFGRDLGFPKAIFLDCLKDLPASDDGTSGGMFVRAKGRSPNHGHHAQEVMNGTRNELYLPYRAFWFYLLSQGQLKAGTANSDSHGLTDNTVGVPRNVVYTDTQAGPSFQVDVFNRAIRSGRVLGTNGPIIEATIDGNAGPVAYGLTPFSPASSARLHLKVSAAPWVPVQEIRIVVNGKVAQVIGGAAITQSPDPFGTSGTLRYQGDLPLIDLLAAAGVSGDAWLVVEAGRPLPLAGDLGGGLNNQKDGIPDTTDNNGDGVVDQNDVQPGRSVGPLNDPPAPTDPADPQFHYSRVLGGGYPAAFTNPFILDLNGDGRFTPPLVAGSR